MDAQPVDIINMLRLALLSGSGGLNSLLWVACMQCTNAAIVIYSGLVVAAGQDENHTIAAHLQHSQRYSNDNSISHVTCSIPARDLHWAAITPLYMLHHAAKLDVQPLSRHAHSQTL
jgi:hypothetical protein